MTYTLYGVRGWGSALAETMLDVAGLTYDFVDVDGFDASGRARDRLLAVNPLAQVPALVLPTGEVMTESAAIALYLSEIAPEAPLAPPPGAPERPRFLRWLVWLVANIYPTFTYGDYPERWTGDPESLRKSTDARREELWRMLEPEVGAPHFLGERLSALDVYLAAMVHWRPRRAWFEAEAPRIAAAARAALDHPAIAAAIKRIYSGAAA
jgi:GST-like protein